MYYIFLQLQRPTIIDVSCCAKEGRKMAKDPVCGMFEESQNPSGTLKMRENTTFVESNV